LLVRVTWEEASWHLKWILGKLHLEWSLGKLHLEWSLRRLHLRCGLESLGNWSLETSSILLLLQRLQRLLHVVALTKVLRLLLLLLLSPLSSGSTSCVLSLLTATSGIASTTIVSTTVATVVSSEILEVDQLESRVRNRLLNFSQVAREQSHCCESVIVQLVPEVLHRDTAQSRHGHHPGVLCQSKGYGLMTYEGLMANLREDEILPVIGSERHELVGLGDSLRTRTRKPSRLVIDGHREGISVDSEGRDSLDSAQTVVNAQVEELIPAGILDEPPDKRGLVVVLVVILELLECPLALRAISYLQVDSQVLLNPPVHT
jgi:hypothetical protein